MSDNTETKETTADAGEQQSAPTQEQIDRIVKDRLERERKKFEREKSDLLKQYEGIDIDEYKKLKQDIEERENRKLEEQGKFEEIRKKWSNERDQIKADYEKALAEKEAMLKRLVLDEKVRTVALKSGVFPEDIEDVMILTSRFFAMDKDGGIRVLGDDGTESTDSLDDFFAKTFKERKPKFYKGLTSTGTGSSGSAQSARQVDDLDTKYAEAQKRGDVASMVKLKRMMAEANKT